jgi:hypothetical protein
MPEEVWYYHHGGAQAGPVTWEKMQELAKDGGIGPDDLIWKQDTPDWVPARSVKDLFPEGAVPPPVPGGPPPVPRKPRGPFNVNDFLPHIKVVELLLELLRKVFSEKLLDAVDKWAKIIGHFGYTIAAVIAFLFAVIWGIVLKTPALAFGALAIIPVAALLHYVAMIFLDAGKAVIDKSPSQLSTKAVLDCLGLVAFVGALCSLVGGIILALDSGFEAFLAGIGATLVLLYLGATALNPGAVNVKVGGKASAGEEAISIVSYFMKLVLLRIMPFVFGIGAACTALFAFYLFIPLIQHGAGASPEKPMLALMMLVEIPLLPFIGYLLFLLYYLLFDLLRSILIVPGKIDALREPPPEAAPEAETKAMPKVKKK